VQPSLDFSISLKYNLAIKVNGQRKEGKMADTLFLLLFWSGPIGLGIGLTLIGTFVLLLAKANEISKRTKAMEKEKGLEKKRE